MAAVVGAEAMQGEIAAAVHQAQVATMVEGVVAALAALTLLGLANPEVAGQSVLFGVLAVLAVLLHSHQQM